MFDFVQKKSIFQNDFVLVNVKNSGTLKEKRTLYTLPNKKIYFWNVSVPTTAKQYEKEHNCDCCIIDMKKGKGIGTQLLSHFD